MTIDEAKRKLRAHLDKRGFTDIEVNVTGGYDPTETDENSTLIQAQIATYKDLGIVPSINPRMAGSWPGVRFTGPPLNLAGGRFRHGLRHRGACAGRVLPDRQQRSEDRGHGRGGAVVRAVSVSDRGVTLRRRRRRYCARNFSISGKTTSGRSA